MESAMEQGLFRPKYSIPVDYDRQGYIYFWSKRYKKLKPEEKEIIEKACKEAGEEYWQAVLEFVTTSNGIVKVSMRHHLSESTLYRAIRRYYIIISKTIG